MKKGPVILTAVLLLFMFAAIGIYNSLITLNENVAGKWSQIDNQLKRRSELIPNLVETVKAYASHEKAAIDSVVEARAKLASSSSPEEKANADSELAGALGRLLVIVENYPDLKADKTFTAMMDELSGTENRIAVARGDYNEAVRRFNTKIRTFPSKIFADMLKFDSKEYYAIEESAKSVPQVNF